MLVGHNLEEAVRRCAVVGPQLELLSIRLDLGSFPDINERYRGSEAPLVYFGDPTNCTIHRSHRLSISYCDSRKTLRVRV
jgi:hypothetical protein